MFFAAFLPFPSVPEWHVPGGAAPSDWVLEWEDKWGVVSVHPHQWHRTWVRQTTATTHILWVSLRAK